MSSEIDVDTAKSAALFKRLEEELVDLNGDAAYVYSGQTDSKKNAQNKLLGKETVL